jgi:hypothetical protein
VVKVERIDRKFNRFNNEPLDRARQKTLILLKFDKIHGRRPTETDARKGEHEFD